MFQPGASHQALQVYRAVSISFGYGGIMVRLWMGLWWEYCRIMMGLQQDHGRIIVGSLQDHGGSQ